MPALTRRTVDEGILELRLNRPDRLNALTAPLVGELLQAFHDLRDDRETRVVILTGSGKGFCAGADLQEPAAPGGDVIETGLSGCDVGMSHLLPRIAGAGVAVELMLTGRVFDAAEARELRIVSRVTEPEALDAAALEVARSITEHSECGAWMTKKGLQLALDAERAARDGDRRPHAGARHVHRVFRGVGARLRREAHAALEAAVTTGCRHTPDSSGAH